MMSLPMTRRNAVLACAAMVTADTRAADAFPSKPVRVVVPYAVGGTDAVTRQLAQRLTELSKETFYVENKPGADGTIGAAMVASGAARRLHAPRGVRDSRCFSLRPSTRTCRMTQ
jgi:tripartite-type tricarboxylate transporter receptor subunit TctC